MCVVLDIKYVKFIIAIYKVSIEGFRRDFTQECIFSVLETSYPIDTQKDDRDLSSLSYYDYWLVSVDKFNNINTVISDQQPRVCFLHCEKLRALTD